MKKTDLNRGVLKLALATLVGALAAGPALSAPAAEAAPASFKSYDNNGDGMLSPEEFRAMGGYEQAFRQGDANRDNSLNPDEFVMARANNDRLKAGKFVDDAWISAKVKALLLKDEAVKGLDVNVETHKGTVQLSGWVNSAAQIAQAERITRSVEGVNGVKNDLQIKR